MTITDIKNELHQLVAQTDDLDILKLVQQLLIVTHEKKEDWWDSLSTKEQQLINVSIGQADNGELISQADARTRIKNWLKAKN